MVDGSFRFRVGALSCFVLCDSSDTLTEQDITNMFAKDIDQMLPRFRALTAPLMMSANVLCVETAGKRVLIDTGSGLVDPTSQGSLLNHLRAINIEPQSIDTVILSHYHLDHVGGLLDADSHAAFPKARLIAPKREHDHWMRESFLAEMDPNRAARLRQTFGAYAECLALIDHTAEIEPGIRYVPALGHTPGHSGVVIESQGERLLHIVDAMHLPIQLDALDASPKFDSQRDAAIATRKTLVNQIEAEKGLMLAYHFPFPGLGYIQRHEERLEWQPYSTSPRM